MVRPYIGMDFYNNNTSTKAWHIQRSIVSQRDLALALRLQRTIMAL